VRSPIVLMFIVLISSNARADADLVNFGGGSERAKAGFRHIIEGRALPSPLPASAAAVLLPVRDPAGRWRAEGWLPNPLVRGLGVGEAAVEGGVTKTCFHCHAGTAGGKLIAGLASTHLDMVPSLESFAKNADRLDARDAKVADYRAHVEDVVLPASRFAAARGDNLGTHSVWAHAARIADPARTGILLAPKGAPEVAELQRIFDAAPLPTVDPLPWWTIKYRDRAYWFSDAPGHDPLAFNLNFYVLESAVDRPENFDQHRAKVAARAALIGEVLQYARETQPPPMPRDAQRALLADWEQVKHGEALFQKMKCASCHGAHELTDTGVAVRFPNRGLMDVKTDPAYSETMLRFAPLADRITAAGKIYGAHGPYSEAVTRPGYVAPPLVGIWASAPYLHNGSVPTLADLFEAPERRPRIWARRIDDAGAYDFEKVGLDHEVVAPETHAARLAAAAGKAATSAEAIEARRAYDTRQPGRSNAGHAFATGLTAGEKSALLAFLKALSPMPGREDMGR
jgi:hypothetical protein